MRYHGAWLVVLPILVSGCGSASNGAASAGTRGTPATPGSSAHASSRPSSGAASSTRTPLDDCGPAPVSDGPLTGLVGASLTGPTTAVSGSELRLRVQLRSLDGRSHLFESGHSELSVLKQGRVVGEYEGGELAYGLQATVGASPIAPWEVTGLMAGCPRHPVDDGWPDLTRKPLPPGSYDVVAVLPDVSGKPSGDLVSAPLHVEVTADPKPLRSCGDVPVSTEPPQSRVTGTLTGPSTAKAGTTVQVQIALHSNLGRAEHFQTGTTIDVLAVRDGSVVGRAFLAHAGSQVEVTVPAQGDVPLLQPTAFTLSGCPEPPDGTNPTRAPLPRGTYQVVAEIADGNGVLVTEPLQVLVT